ncbi:protein starmaker-like [Drosophila subpulchrella]|uniref:protein starmaker-like n=1 Tax=Drosophila subpulchrella TaxID=1486046 RepID=UPI0018A135BB|nr:protein starmaker-like [Drosophila subpulchrella]
MNLKVFLYGFLISLLSLKCVTSRGQKRKHICIDLVSDSSDSDCVIVPQTAADVILINSSEDTKEDTHKKNNSDNHYGTHRNIRIGRRKRRRTSIVIVSSSSEADDEDLDTKKSNNESWQKTRSSVRHGLHSSEAEKKDESDYPILEDSTMEDVDLDYDMILDDDFFKRIEEDRSTDTCDHTLINTQSPSWKKWFTSVKAVAGAGPDYHIVYDISPKDTEKDTHMDTHNDGENDTQTDTQTQADTSKGDSNCNSSDYDYY